MLSLNSKEKKGTRCQKLENCQAGWNCKVLGPKNSEKFQNFHSKTTGKSSEERGVLSSRLGKEQTRPQKNSVIQIQKQGVTLAENTREYPKLEAHRTMRVQNNQQRDCFWRRSNPRENFNKFRSDLSPILTQTMQGSITNSGNQMKYLRIQELAQKWFRKNMISERSFPSHKILQGRLSTNSTQGWRGECTQNQWITKEKSGILTVTQTKLSEIPPKQN